MATKKTKLKSVAKKRSNISPRRLVAPKKRSIKLWRLKPGRDSKPQRIAIPAARKLFWRSMKHIYKNWKLYGSITLVYFVLSVVLVKGFESNTSLPTVKATLLALTNGNMADITTGVSMFGFLVGSNGPQTDVASVYQTMLLIITSLAFIWALRQTYSGKKAKMSQAFYRGMYPLIPFVLVVLVIILQLIPLLLASMLYGEIFTKGLAVNMMEITLWGLALCLMALSSLYMITASIFGLYIVTLPEMTPSKALRTAKGLVRHRRWIIMRKILFLPMILLLAAGLLTIPIVVYATTFAVWLLFGLTIVSLLIVHSYFYALYRELML